MEVDSHEQDQSRAGHVAGCSARISQVNLDELAESAQLNAWAFKYYIFESLFKPLVTLKNPTIIGIPRQKLACNPSLDSGMRTQARAVGHALLCEWQMAKTNEKLTGCESREDPPRAPGES